MALFYSAGITGANMSATGYALLGFVTWTLLLLVWMEILRTHLVVSGRVPANGFTPDNAGLSPFLQRLARAHANCIEGLPIFGGLMGVAMMTSRTGITDSLAYWFIAARLIQSAIHLASTSPNAVKARFSAFAVQMAIGLYWAVKLLAG
ncbi:MAPEG family protein [Mesorhizobium sp. CA12]|uniref:MAPEG family protein n=1 Tax=Mesorhizobium sp. CA12 TaxID=2876644 RepID=UPI001CCABCA5|nr:MAPEG family protein [Mesorhizobium sp. CA12]MBZ9859217.1 MAPEG family protein [Mesorhizobium sp. CA12]